MFQWLLHQFFGSFSFYFILFIIYLLFIYLFFFKQNKKQKQKINRLIGEYCEKIPHIAPDILRQYSKTFSNEVHF